MILNGMLFAVVGFFIEFVFFKDYWNPPLLFKFGEFGGIEDLMFGFAAGSFGSVFYNVVFRSKLKRVETPRVWIVPLVLIVQSLSFLVLSHVFDINSIYASSIGWLIPTTMIIMIRKDLVKEIIISAIIGGFILVLGEGLFLLLARDYLEDYFLLYGRVPILLDIFPVTEFIWGLSFAALISPLYEFATGRSAVDMKK